MYLGTVSFCQPAQYSVVRCQTAACQPCHFLSVPELRKQVVAFVILQDTMSFDVTVVTVGCNCHLQDMMSFGVTVVSVGCNCHLQDTMSFGVTVVSVCCNCHLQEANSFHVIIVPGGSILLSARDTMSFSVTVVPNLPACSVRHSAILCKLCAR